MSSPDTRIVRVELGARSYLIHIGSGLLAGGGLLRKLVEGHQVAVITNEVVAPLMLDALLRHFKPDTRVDVFTLADGESQKSLANYERILDFLIDRRHNRSTTLIALGGGVVGDITGFAAATYQRGVRFLQIPTTLLAQVDSSVGGKTAVNHPAGKNLIGAFHQPVAVVADLDLLETLPDRELRAGFAEVVKYGIIADRDVFRVAEPEYPCAARQRAGRAHPRSGAIVRDQGRGRCRRRAGVRFTGIAEFRTYVRSCT